MKDPPYGYNVMRFASTVVLWTLTISSSQAAELLGTTTTDAQASTKTTPVGTPSRKKPDLIFSCLTAKNKRIQVLDFGNTLQYSYGKPGKPELIFETPRKNVTYAYFGDLTGAGGTGWMSFPKGSLKYIVYSGGWLDRPSGKSKWTAGISVYNAKNEKSNFDLSSEKPFYKRECIKKPYSRLYYNTKGMINEEIR